MPDWIEVVILVKVSSSKEADVSVIRMTGRKQKLDKRSIKESIFELKPILTGLDAKHRCYRVRWRKVWCFSQTCFII